MLTVGLTTQPGDIVAPGGVSNYAAHMRKVIPIAQDHSLRPCVHVHCCQCTALQCSLILCKYFLYSFQQMLHNGDAKEYANH